MILPESEQHVRRCKCGCGTEVNRTWHKGHHGRGEGGFALCREIRRLRDQEGVGWLRLAKRFGVSKATVRRKYEVVWAPR